MKFKLKQIFKDISLTFFTEIIVLIAFFLIYRLIADNFGPEGVGEYSLIKKVTGLFQPLLLLGLGVGLPRYIAMSRDKYQQAVYIKTGALVVAVFAFIFLIFVNLFGKYFAKIFFGSVDYANLILPLSFFITGLILHSLVYSYFRGCLLVKVLNSLQIINLSLVPIVLLIIFKNITVEKLITFIGIATFVISFFFSLSFVRNFFIHTKKWQFKKILKELFYYSLPRVPGDFALAGLLSLGPIFAAHFTTIEEAGYLSVSQSLLKTTGMMLAPLGLILLPKISNLIINGKSKIIKENLNFLIGAVLQCSVFVSFQVILFTDVIIKYWLGSEFLGAVPAMQIIFISMFFYAFYIVTRSILDAIVVKPLNTINVFISLGVFLFSIVLLLFLIKPFSSIINLSIAFTFGIICLGVLTYISIRKIYAGRFKKDLDYLLIAIIINILLGVIAILSKPFITSTIYYLVVFEILIGCIYLKILWWLKMEWIRKIFKRIIIQD